MADDQIGQGSVTQARCLGPVDPVPGPDLVGAREHLISIGRDPDPKARWDRLTDYLEDHTDVVELLLPDLVASDDQLVREVGASLVCIAAAFRTVEHLQRLARRWLSLAFEHEQEGQALDDLLTAVGHNGDASKCDVVLRHVDDPDPDIRGACAFAFGGMFPDDLPEAIDGLVALAGDPVADVRDWAIFALGRGRLDVRPVATAEAIAAYRAAADDPDEEVRAEARAALGLLGDVPALEWSLENDLADDDWLEVIANVAEPRLEEPLQRWRERQDFDPADPRYVAALAAVRGSSAR